jgi:S-formylglutathione hydrolase FrmB
MALIHCNFHSEVLQLAVTMDVLLPQAACLKGRRVPVLYLLHGLSDDHTIWQRRTSIERYADARGLAVVMPAVDRSFYTDMTRGPRYWTYVSEEVPRVAASFFPLSDRRRDTFVAGLSMGGFGAFKLALNHPDRYAAAASLSGALDLIELGAQGEADPERQREMAGIFGSREALAGSANDLVHLARQVAKGRRQPHLYQCCGTEDFLYANNQRFRRRATRAGLKITYEQGPGEHEWGYWDQQIQRVLAWLPRS